jgi:hypothetical protein
MNWVEMATRSGDVTCACQQYFNQILTLKKDSIAMIHIYCSNSPFLFKRTWAITLRRGADKSLARPTSRCRRTETIVSLERGVCSCAELLVFSCCRGWKEACQAERNFNNIETRAIIKSPPPARQDAEGNSRQSNRNIRGTCTIVCHFQKLGGPT